jgi:hypothetical protein
MQIAPQQLQATVGRERLGNELDGEIALDHPSQGRYLQAHQRGLQCVRERMGMLSLKKPSGGLYDSDVSLDHASVICRFRVNSIQ